MPTDPVLPTGRVSRLDPSGGAPLLVKLCRYDHGAARPCGTGM